MATPGTLVHVVRLGEHLHEIAVRHGVTVDAIWSLPANKSLKEAGRTPDVLCSGDVLYVPIAKRKFLPMKVGQTTKFTARLPTVDVTVKLVGVDGKPLGEEPYEVSGMDVKGTTDGDGVFRLKAVPISQKTLSVQLAKTRTTLSVNVGYLDPVTTLSWKAQRLAHLGYLYSSQSRISQATIDLAIETFLSTHAPGAKTTAEIETALVNRHGA